MDLPRKPLAVIFDMDGILFDTESLYMKAASIAASQLGSTMPREVYLRTIGLAEECAIPVLKDHFGEDFDIPALRTATRTELMELIQEPNYLKTGVNELLDLLDDRVTPRAIATSSAHPSVKHHLSVHDLGHRFETIVARGDYARAKPNPDPFLLAANRLGVAPVDCIALEDSHIGVRAASSAGMMTIMVPDLLEATDEIAALCVGVARDLHHVREVVSDLL